MLLAGATAVGVGTVTFREPRAMLRILDELEAWCAEHGVAAVADLTGALKEEERMTTIEVPVEVRDRLVLGLDVGDARRRRGDRARASRPGSAW